MVIVKRIVPPPAGSSTKSYEYLAKGTRWTSRPSEARTFTHEGHAKNALQRGMRYKRPPSGSTVIICDVVLVTKNPREYIVP